MNDKMDAILRGRKFKKLADMTFKSVRSRYDMKQIEVEVLFFLYNNPEATSSDIYRTLTLHRGHVSMAMDDLCKKGYLRAEQDKNDRRYVSYEMTAGGKEVAEEIAKLWFDMKGRLFDGITTEELEYTKRILTKVSDNIDKLGVD